MSVLLSFYLYLEAAREYFPGGKSELERYFVLYVPANEFTGFPSD